MYRGALVSGNVNISVDQDDRKAIERWVPSSPNNEVWRASNDAINYGITI